MTLPLGVPPVRPPRLRRGDTVAALSLSWGGPAAFPAVYESGVQNLERHFGLKVREYPTTRASALDLWEHPEARAADLDSALRDPSIAGVVATIGGDDACRVLPHLTRGIGVANPKVVLGFSDTSTVLLRLLDEGLTTFLGPSVMAGFAQLDALPRESAAHLRDLLFEPHDSYEYPAFPTWSEGYPRWEEEGNADRISTPRPHDGWHWLDGSSRATGELVGGCAEVLEFLKGTPYWPAPEFWDGKILCLETSEVAPSVVQVKWMLRNYGLAGILGRLQGLLVGRARGYSTAQKEELDEVIFRVVREEFHARDLAVVTNLDFGHTDPQWVIPLGGTLDIDPDERALTLRGPVLT